MESFASRDAAYYFNNVIYDRVHGDSVLPHGGKRAAFVAAVWRPEPVCRHVQRHRAPAWRVVYCAIIAVPAAFLGETDPETFWEKARTPRIVRGCAVRRTYVVFVTTLYPAYDAIIQAGGTEAEELASEGPVVLQRHRRGGPRRGELAVLQHAASSLAARLARAKATGKNPVVAFSRPSVAADRPAFSAATSRTLDVHYFGGSHWLVDVCVTEKVGYVDFDQDANTGGTFTIENYELLMRTTK